jgi:hypothetical protein
MAGKGRDSIAKSHRDVSLRPLQLGSLLGSKLAWAGGLELVPSMG